MSFFRYVLQKKEEKSSLLRKKKINKEGRVIPFVVRSRSSKLTLKRKELTAIGELLSTTLK